MRAIPSKLWLLAVLSAGLQILPFPLAGPVPLWRRAFCWICLTPLLWVVLYGKNKQGSALKPLQATWVGYACGVVWYAGNCYWIYQTMYLYGGIPKPLSLGILILFSLYLGLYHALFAGVLGWLSKLYSPTVALCAAPFLWIAVELARGRITGFPWDLLGYTQVDSYSLIKLAPITGVMGISFLIAAVNAGIISVITSPKPFLRWTSTAAVLTVLLWAYRPGPIKDWVPFSGNASAVLLQENLKVGAAVQMQRPESKEEMIASFSALSIRPQEGYLQSPQLIVWPEAPADFWDNDPVFQNALSNLARVEQAPVIADEVTIAPRDADGTGHLYNSAKFINADGTAAGRYDKMHLVPFGEYTPYKPLFFFVGHLLDNLPFVQGGARRLFMAGEHHYGVFICYESIFGDEVRQFVDNGADVLVNISDDGWYGDTSAPWEHLDMARMRAIENNRWLLRATNTGVTGAIAPDGRITQELPRHVRSSIEVGFNYLNGRTFYTRHGDWLAWLCVLLSVGALGSGLVRRRFMRPAQVH